MLDAVWKDIGTSRPKSEPEAAQLLRELALRGQMDASFGLGVMHLYAVGIPENDDEGIYWSRRAAERGHRVAQDFLTKLGRREPRQPNHGAPCSAVQERAHSFVYEFSERKTVPDDMVPRLLQLVSEGSENDWDAIMLALYVASQTRGAEIVAAVLEHTLGDPGRYALFANRLVQERGREMSGWLFEPDGTAIDRAILERLVSCLGDSRPPIVEMAKQILTKVTWALGEPKIWDPDAWKAWASRGRQHEGRPD